MDDGLEVIDKIKLAAEVWLAIWAVSCADIITIAALF
jgi:hypothetical protein